MRSKCKYCHSTDHVIDSCPSIVCKQCKGNHPVWMCQIKQQNPLATSPIESNPTSPGPNEMVSSEAEQVIAPRAKNPVPASSYWNKRDRLNVDDSSYKFSSTNSLASPLSSPTNHSHSQKIPPASSLQRQNSVESNEGNRKRRDRDRKGGNERGGGGGGGGWGQREKGRDQASYGEFATDFKRKSDVSVEERVNKQSETTGSVKREIKKMEQKVEQKTESIPREIKAEDLNVKYYQKMLETPWGDLIA